MKKYKNITVLLLIIVVTIVGCAYALKWHQVYRENNLNKSIITSYIQEIKAQELKNYISDNPYSVIYFGISSDSNCRAFEVKLKNYILDNNLKETFVYLNVSDLDKDNFQSAFDSKYNNDTLRSQNKYLYEVPAIAVYNHITLTDFISDKDLTVEKVNQFLIRNNIVGE